jgi:Flp pilus assembly protein TadD
VPLASARAWVGLSELALASGDSGQAIIQARRAAEMFRDLGASPEQARALTLLSDACMAAGDVAAAQTASAQVSALCAGNPPATNADV